MEIEINVINYVKNTTYTEKFTYLKDYVNFLADLGEIYWRYTVNDGGRQIVIYE